MPQSSIALGQVFSERGNNHVIKIITARVVTADFNDGSTLHRKGEIYRPAAEDEGDLGNHQIDPELAVYPAMNGSYAQIFI